jgi:hypothetical protein
MICKNHYGTGSFLAGGKIMHQISIIVRAGLAWLGLAWLGLAWLGLAWHMGASRTWSYRNIKNVPLRSFCRQLFR